MALASMESAYPGVAPEVHQFIRGRSRRMLIDGKWVEAASGKTLTTYDPATEEPLAEVPAGDKEDVYRAVRAARRAFESGPWRRMTPSERGRALWKLADLIEARTIALAGWVRELKRTSSLWVKEQPAGPTGFQWQAGYGAFSVSQSQSAAVERYIARQDAHHQRVSFQDEFRTLLVRHQITYDERYLWY